MKVAIGMLVRSPWNLYIILDSMNFLIILVFVIYKYLSVFINFLHQCFILFSVQVFHHFKFFLGVLLFLLLL